MQLPSKYKLCPGKSQSIRCLTKRILQTHTIDSPVARNFAYVYAVISVGILVYGYVLYQHRITMIRRRDPGHFDQIAGPVIISAFLFCAMLANFVIRVRELRKEGVTIPGLAFLMPYL